MIAALPNLFRCLILLTAGSACLGVSVPAVQADDVQKQVAFPIPADADLPGVGPMRRYGWFKNVWKNRRSTFAANKAASKNAVVFLGDSITQGWQDNFRGDFGDLNVANRGISGDTTRGMLYRLQEDVLDLDPKAVVMLMGTNDLEENATPEQIAANVKDILAALKKHDAEMPIVLCHVFPSHASKKRPADKINQVNQLFGDLARGDAQITVLDTWTLFADASGDAKKEEFPDLLHPNAAGYAKWKAALVPIFATLGLIETKAEPFEYEDNATVLFNGHDLTGWGFLPTTEQMRQGRARWIPKTNGRVTWPLVEKEQWFDGKTVTPKGRYAAIAGRLVVTTPPEGRKIQQLWTQREFNDDFELVLEFRATPAADSGVFLRGKQLQCRDYWLAGPYKDLKAYKPGQWNELVVKVHGTQASCTCNGEVIETDFQIPATGRIGLEGDRGQIEYRHIRLRPTK
ncbi:multifunctional acyl-CoA thioesterase I and protease I and lysophospholipase L1 [Stieleria bergensis]|uniref:Multifunctional acyl-CoA thioesterase I and protease I and lysophospholipase L1 n=1 Tax=Stieleria bergensis TaxID=2528025 RepID=A0A517SYP0_9BACT|nr:multifunctional acyl-CoA thioesterase I and protease I and lysophospholipase L1 [Planctomycetes bacterium SV_7m_r]